MLSQVEREVAAVWPYETNAIWLNDDFGQVSAIGSEKTKRNGVVDDGAVPGGLLDKVNDDKLARDVEDLSAIFEELEGGVVDFALPCDEEDVATGAQVTGDWIGDLEKDAVNVDELSSMFDVLVDEQTSLLMETNEHQAIAQVSLENDHDVSMDQSDDEYDYDDNEEDAVDDTNCDGGRTISARVIPAAPVWASMAPVDPRSVIRTPIFKNLDSRIPRVDIPRMDLAFGGSSFVLQPVHASRPARAVSSVSPKSCQEKKTKKVTSETAYRHDPSLCWICQSNKSSYKKVALHRYLEKRHRRNWKRGPRYSGRSNVATSRVREGGRFVTTAHWV